MQIPWFFATTPAPTWPGSAHVIVKRTTGSTTRSWWARTALRLEAWGQRSQQSRTASLHVL
jgi:hypothetical protein